jgi:LacI family transcriptional regulator
MSERVTMEDIARHSGVSLTTVSLVLRDKPGINDETRRRVLDMAHALGYRRKQTTEAPSAQGLQQVGVAVKKARLDDEPGTNQFYAPVLAGIEAACRRQQTNLLYATVLVDEDNHPQELPRMLLEDDLDGLLLVGAFVDATIARLMQRRARPTVLVDAYAADNAYDSVVSDNFRGAYQAVSYLIDQGHRHIGVVGSMTNSYPSVEERRRGYLQALRDHGVAGQYLADSHLTHVEAAAAAADLLRRAPWVTALFCCNDLIAIEVMRTARALGRHVPEDLSIVGFDDIDLAAHVAPPLTTMQVDKVSMGRMAVQLLAQRVEFPDASCVTAVLRPTLVERQSVRSVVAEAEVVES